MGALSFYSLAREKSGRSMEPFIVDVRPSSGGESLLSTHEGEEFIYVLRGEIEVRYGAEKYSLSEGDSIYYDSIVPHQVSARAGSEKPARLVAVISAPF
jgi:quercetin dioxygenase-like cupin family protein